MEKNNNQYNNSLLYSLLVSMENIDEHEQSLEDVLYSYFPKVTKCQKMIYELVIRKLSEGLSYDEIIKMIDELDIISLYNLDDKQNSYIKEKAKKDVLTRKRKLEKIEGEKKQ